ncbi:MAG: LysM peptidoglycan-binding domain-containing protein [Anaerolineales bacterium]
MKRRTSLLLALLVGLCSICILVGGAVYSLQRPEEAKPVVLIKSPGYGEEVNLYQTTLLQAIVRDPQGVMRVELWVDRELLAVKTSRLPRGSNPFPFIETWQPKNPGSHVLVVRAYNSAKKSGQASITLKAVEGAKPEPTPIAHEVQPGESLETIAAKYDVRMEDILGGNPGLEEPLKPGDKLLIPPPPEIEDPPRPEETAPELLPGEEPPQPVERIELSPLSEMAIRLFPRVPSPPIPQESEGLISLQVEGVYLVVDKEYQGVSCYLSLAGSDVERIPEEGYLENLGGTRWDIEAQMGEENKRIVLIPRSEGRLDVMVNCIGYNEYEQGSLIFDLGTLMASHTAEEWDGRLIERLATGLHGWFKVGYRISPFPPLSPSEERPAPPTNLMEGAVLDGYGWEFGLYFDYPTGAENVDGYLIYRNDTLLAEVTHPALVSSYPDRNTWFAPISRADFYPSCPNRYEFYVTAYRDTPQGRLESEHSNSVFVDADPVPCYRSKVVRVTFNYLHTGCLDLDDHLFQQLCTKGQYGSVNQQMGREPCDCNHDPRFWPIPEGDVWVNGEKAEPSLWQDFDSATTYDVTYFRPVTLILGPSDDLTIRMELRDPDMWSRADKFCTGEYTIGHWELDEIAKAAQGERERSYRAEFSNDNGTCWLDFVVEVLAELEE